MAIKMTFTLDDETAGHLERAAALTRRPKSEVVREAIREFAQRAGMLSETERKDLLQAFDRLIPTLPPRPRAEIDAELGALRDARRTGGRLHAPARDDDSA